MALDSHSPHLYIEDRTARGLDDITWVKWPSKGQCMGFLIQGGFLVPTRRSHVSKVRRHEGWSVLIPKRNCTEKCADD